MAQHSQEEYNAALAAFLETGGKIQEIGRNVSGGTDGGGYSAWGAKKKSDNPLASIPEEHEGEEEVP